METIAILTMMVAGFAAVLFFKIRLVWRRYRVIAITLPVGSDPQAFNYRLTESIRRLRYREDAQPGAVRVFRAPAWQRWAVGLQDIAVEPAGSEMVLVTGPAFNVSLIRRSYPNAIERPYAGPQPVWPLFKGFMRIFGVGVASLAAIGLAVFLFAPR